MKGHFPGFQVFIFGLNSFSDVLSFSSLSIQLHILEPTKAAVSVLYLTIQMFRDLNLNSFLRGYGDSIKSETSFMTSGGFGQVCYACRKAVHENKIFTRLHNCNGRNCRLVWHDWECDGWYHWAKRCNTQINRKWKGQGERMLNRKSRQDKIKTFLLFFKVLSMRQQHWTKNLKIDVLWHHHHHQTAGWTKSLFWNFSDRS